MLDIYKSLQKPHARHRLAALLWACCLAAGVAQAQQDPVHQLQPERAAPGQSLLLSMARSLGAERSAGWARLHDDGDAEVEALKAGRF